MKISIIKGHGNGKAPVLKHYVHDLYYRPAFISLDCKQGVMVAEYSACDASTADEWHGHVRRYEISPFATGRQINALFTEIAPLAQQLLDGYESVWNGNNFVAELDQDAQNAEEQIESIISDAYMMNDWPTSRAAHEYV